MDNPNMIVTLLCLIYFAHLTIAQPDFIGVNCRSNNSIFTNNSTYRTNLDSALSTITSNVNTTIYGFTNTSVGRDPDTAYALALCRGDIDQVTCGQCVRDATRLIRDCPNRRDAIGWYEFCRLSYSSSSSLLTDMDESSAFYLYNTGNVTDATQFNVALNSMLEDLRRQAAGGGPLRKFATGNVSGPVFLDIYGLMQCTPNLSGDECFRCLTGSIADIPACCSGRRGGRVIKPSCNLRFETTTFFQETPVDATQPTPSPPPLQSPSPPPLGENDNRMRTVLITAVPIVLFVLLFAAIWIYISKRKKTKPFEPILENVDDISTAESLQYDLETIRTATDDFSDSNKLGQGGFGAVYKGTLQNGLEIAVKRLSVNSGQGSVEFKNEVVLLAKLQHRNLVRLLGFCLQGIERLLIYEFVPNASLDHFIFDPVHKVDLDWDRRYKIISGVARGLLYLHEDSRLRIIHRDLKASNILLDSEMTPKIADFGMAKLFERDDETQGNTSRIAGTYGYMAPEYAMRGQFSVKSDVYSFGVLILEIVSGQKNNCFQNGENVEDLLSYAWISWKEQKCTNLIDPILRSGSSSIRDIMRCIHIGLLCVQENVSNRPTMASIVLMLNSFSITLPVPSEPAFFMHSSVFGPNKSYYEEYSSPASESSEKNILTAEVSIDDRSITKLYPR